MCGAHVRVARDTRSTTPYTRGDREWREKRQGSVYSCPLPSRSCTLLRCIRHSSSVDEGAVRHGHLELDKNNRVFITQEHRTKHCTKKTAIGKMAADRENTGSSPAASAGGNSKTACGEGGTRRSGGGGESRGLRKPLLVSRAHLTSRRAIM